MKTKGEIEREAQSASQALVEAVRKAVEEDILPATSQVGAYAWRAAAAAERMGMDPTDVIGDQGQAVMEAIIDTLRREQTVTAAPEDPVWYRVGLIAAAASKHIVDRIDSGLDNGVDRGEYINRLARRFRDL